MTLRMAAGDPEGAGVVCLFKRKKALSLGTGPWAARVLPVRMHVAVCLPRLILIMFFFGGAGVSVISLDV